MAIKILTSFLVCSSSFTIYVLAYTNLKKILVNVYECVIWGI